VDGDSRTQVYVTMGEFRTTMQQWHIGAAEIDSMVPKLGEPSRPFTAPRATLTVSSPPVAWIHTRCGGGPTEQSVRLLAEVSRQRLNRHGSLGLPSSRTGAPLTIRARTNKALRGVPNMT
jgi:hypothetical protein